MNKITIEVTPEQLNSLVLGVIDRESAFRHDLKTLPNDQLNIDYLVEEIDRLDGLYTYLTSKEQQ